MNSYSIVYCHKDDADYTTEDGFPAVDIAWDKGININTTPETRPKSCAKKIVYNNGNARYFIKYNPNFSIFNPKQPEHKRDSEKLMHGIPMWSFQSVTKQGFESYIDFLKTGDTQQLNQARRLM